MSHEPQSHFPLAGLAGTYGQRTASRFLRSIFEQRGQRWGWIGSSVWSDGIEIYPRSPSSAAPLLARLRDRGCRGAILEISASDLAVGDDDHGDDVKLDAAAILSLSDHPNPEPSRVEEDRRRLAHWLRRVRPGGAVIVNADDPDAEMLGGVNLQARRIAFGMEPPDLQIQVCGLIDWIDGRGSRIRLDVDDFGAAGPLDLTIPGRFAVSAALAAAALASEFGASLEEIVAGLSSAEFPGAFEPVAVGQPFEVRIDSAQQPGDVARALLTIRELGASQVLCVIGPRGGGQPSDRQALADALEFAADRVFVTTDNPKDDDPATIARDLHARFRDPNRAVLIEDRAQAIQAALNAAEPGDAVLIAGKGRAAVQIYSDRPIPFNDAVIAERHLLRKARRFSA